MLSMFKALKRDDIEQSIESLMDDPKEYSYHLLVTYTGMDRRHRHTERIPLIHINIEVRREHFESAKKDVCFKEEYKILVDKSPEKFDPPIDDILNVLEYFRDFSVNFGFFIDFCYLPINEAWSLKEFENNPKETKTIRMDMLLEHKGFVDMILVGNNRDKAWQVLRSYLLYSNFISMMTIVP